MARKKRDAVQAQDDPAPEGGATPDADAPSNLLAMMPRWLVVLLAVASFLIATVALFCGMLFPGTVALLETGTGRFVFCLMLSLYLSVFFFVMYPQYLRMAKIPGIDLPIEVVGLPALWIVTFLLLDSWMPLPAVGRLFEIRENGMAVKIPARGVALSPDGNQNDFVWHRVTDSTGDLVGVYIVFPPQSGAVKAVVRAAYRDDQPWEFDRAGKTFEIGSIKNNTRP